MSHDNEEAAKSYESKKDSNRILISPMQIHGPPFAYCLLSRHCILCETVIPIHQVKPSYISEESPFSDTQSLK
jgi:hypothetical protein